MKRLLLVRMATVSCLLLSASAAVIAQDAAAPNPVPFDQYGRINLDEEMKRLDVFAENLIKQPQMTGYIYIQEAQISGAGYAVGHAIEITKYLIKRHHIKRN